MVNVLSFSGGKDSTALLLMMLEKNMPLDCIINVDTTKEFPQMYEHIKQVKEYTGRDIQVVTFDYDFLFKDKEVKRRDGRTQKGYGWATPFFRWCTGYKIKAIEKKLKELFPKKTFCRYIGLAADETKRLSRGKKENFKYPLAKWGISEAQALQYCYDRGFTWGGVYEHFPRVSCFCCPLQSLKALKNLYLNYPKQWEIMKEMDKSSANSFRRDYTLSQLEARFAQEIAQEKAFMKWMTGKEK